MEKNFLKEQELKKRLLLNELINNPEKEEELKKLVEEAFLNYSNEAPEEVKIYFNLILDYFFSEKKSINSTILEHVLYSKPTTIILNKLAQERKFQDILWQREPGKWNSDNGVKLAVLAEEFGEVAKSLLEHESVAELQQELIQVAAVAVAWAEGLEPIDR